MFYVIDFSHSKIIFSPPIFWPTGKLLWCMDWGRDPILSFSPTELKVWQRCLFYNAHGHGHGHGHRWWDSYNEAQLNCKDTGTFSNKRAHLSQVLRTMYKLVRENENWRIKIINSSQRLAHERRNDRRRVSKDEQGSFGCHA